MLVLADKVDWDHPHIHGEHPKDIIFTYFIVGSPPYTWGAHLGRN